jgi:hypothetical protein
MDADLRGWFWEEPPPHVVAYNFQQALTTTTPRLVVLNTGNDSSRRRLQFWVWLSDNILDEVDSRNWDFQRQMFLLGLIHD